MDTSIGVRVDNTSNYVANKQNILKSVNTIGIFNISSFEDIASKIQIKSSIIPPTPTSANTIGIFNTSQFVNNVGTSKIDIDINWKPTTASIADSDMKLLSSRNIAGVAFDGTASIAIPFANIDGLTTALAVKQTTINSTTGQPLIIVNGNGETTTSTTLTWTTATNTLNATNIVASGTGAFTSITTGTATSQLRINNNSILTQGTDPNIPITLQTKGTTSFTITTGTTPNARLTISDTGSVSIGTNTLATGSITAVGNITGGSVASGIRITSGSLSVSGTNTTIPLSISTQSTRNLTLNTNNLTFLTINGSSGSATFSNDTFATTLVSGSLTTSLNNTTTGTITLTGRVGIGKAPHTTYVCDVNGTLNATALLVVGVVIPVWLANTTDVTKIYWNDNNIGIGTTNPTSKLQILHANTAVDGSSGNIALSVSNPTNDLGQSSVMYNGVAGVSSGKVIYSLNVVGSAGWSMYMLPGTTSLRFNPTLGVSGTDAMVLNNNGNVGIGVASPTAGFPLEVGQGTGTTGTSIDFRYFSLSTPLSLLTGYANQLSVKVNGSIWITSTYVTSSDIRIKEDIQDINDDSVLQMILVIEPKTYKYIDKVVKGDKKVYGFITQQIQEVIPEATILQTSYIPNIMILADYNDGIITLPSLPSKVIIKLNDKIKFYDKDNKDNYTEVEEVIDELTFRIKEIEYTDNKIFVYGTEIDDFHTLDKSYIFTFNVCATQELHRKIISQEERIKKLEGTIERLLNYISL